VARVGAVDCVAVRCQVIDASATRSRPRNLLNQVRFKKSILTIRLLHSGRMPPTTRQHRPAGEHRQRFKSVRREPLSAGACSRRSVRPQSRTTAAMHNRQSWKIALRPAVWSHGVRRGSARRQQPAHPARTRATKACPGRRGFESARRRRSRPSAQARSWARA
jgi:hypothetical protein